MQKEGQTIRLYKEHSFPRFGCINKVNEKTFATLKLEETHNFNKSLKLAKGMIKRFDDQKELKFEKEENVLDIIKRNEKKREKNKIKYFIKREENKDNTKDHNLHNIFYFKNNNSTKKCSKKLSKSFNSLSQQKLSFSLKKHEDLVRVMYEGLMNPEDQNDFKYFFSDLNEKESKKKEHIKDNSKGVDNSRNFHQLSSSVTLRNIKISSSDNRYLRSLVTDKFNSLNNEFKSTKSSQFSLMKRASSATHIFLKYNNNVSIKKEVKNICLENYRIKTNILKRFCKKEDDCLVKGEKLLKFYQNKSNKFKRNTLE